MFTTIRCAPQASGRGNRIQKSRNKESEETLSEFKSNSTKLATGCIQYAPELQEQYKQTSSAHMLQSEHYHHF